LIRRAEKREAGNAIRSEFLHPLTLSLRGRRREGPWAVVRRAFFERPMGSRVYRFALARDAKRCNA
jgi:hypothetical protein